jgi:hypothetical protein
MIWLRCTSWPIFNTKPGESLLNQPLAALLQT